MNWCPGCSGRRAADPPAAPGGPAFRLRRAAAQGTRTRPDRESPDDERLSYVYVEEHSDRRGPDGHGVRLLRIQLRPDHAPRDFPETRRADHAPMVCRQIESNLLAASQLARTRRLGKARQNPRRRHQLTTQRPGQTTARKCLCQATLNIYFCRIIFSKKLFHFLALPIKSCILLYELSVFLTVKLPIETRC